MKRYIHSENSTTQMLKNITNAKRELSKYTDEQIELVKQCHEAIVKEISDAYIADKEVQAINLSAIKTDYLMGAIEEDLMTEEEFEDIFDLLDIISLELSQPYA